MTWVHRRLTQASQLWQACTVQLVQDRARVWPPRSSIDMAAQSIACCSCQFFDHRSLEESDQSPNSSAFLLLNAAEAKSGL